MLAGNSVTTSNGAQGTLVGTNVADLIVSERRTGDPGDGPSLRLAKIDDDAVGSVSPYGIACHIVFMGEWTVPVAAIVSNSVGI